MVVARLDPGDIGEDAAAERIGAALAPDPAALGLKVGVAATGRVNFFATGSGVLELDPDAVAAVNAVDPMITLATLPRWARVGDRVMVATVKIIAYGVADAAVRRAAAAASPLRVRPPLMPGLLRSLLAAHPRLRGGRQLFFTASARTPRAAPTP